MWATAASVTLNGLARHRSIEDLRQGLASFVPPSQIDWHVTGVNRVFCPALTRCIPFHPPSARRVGRASGCRWPTARHACTTASRFACGWSMPDFASWLRVDYVVHDGTVQHLYPQLADPKIGIVADPPKSYATRRDGQPGAIRRG